MDTPAVYLMFCNYYLHLAQWTHTEISFCIYCGHCGQWYEHEFKVISSSKLLKLCIFVVSPPEKSLFAQSHASCCIT